MNHRMRSSAEARQPISSDRKMEGKIKERLYTVQSVPSRPIFISARVFRK
jgi:hypothetical protein